MPSASAAALLVRRALSSASPPPPSYAASRPKCAIPPSLRWRASPPTRPFSSRSRRLSTSVIAADDYYVHRRRGFFVSSSSRAAVGPGAVPTSLRRRASPPRCASESRRPWLSSGATTDGDDGDDSSSVGAGGGGGGGGVVGGGGGGSGDDDDDDSGNDDGGGGGGGGAPPPPPSSSSGVSGAVGAPGGAASISGVPPPPPESGSASGGEKKPPASTPSSSESDLDRQLRPSEVVSELNLHIVGQHDAKRAVAIAMRNRWRRRQLPKELMREVTPRNVLMIGPTGCGKTEVARRMAALSDAPFIKVEATKFTEVGYHGRDVDQIVRDLMDISMTLTKKRQTERLRGEAASLAEERLLDLLTGPSASSGSSGSRSRDTFRDMLRRGELDTQIVEVDVPEGGGSDKGGPGGIFTLGGDGTSNPSVQALSELMRNMSSGPNKRGSPTERKRLPISEARDVILEVELERMLEGVDLKKEAIAAVEEAGIVFIDEIDKICTSRDYSSRSADASAEGVQRDLLPLVEGTTISTKYGNVSTDYILFIASGAFHAVKPSDMLPELQGRLPIRVELNGLTEEDLYRILTEPVANLLRQQTELLATEGVILKFDDTAVREIARMAALLNRTVENIGARRLHTVVERIMECLSFDAAEMEDGTELVVDRKLVKERLGEVMISSDLSRYIL